MIDADAVDLSHMRCDIKQLPAKSAAECFHRFLSDVALAVGCFPPTIGQLESGVWQVTWIHSPWRHWAVCGPAFVDGPFAGYASLRNGTYYTKRQRLFGPFFHDIGERWFTETNTGYDVLFSPNW